ncbi:methionine-R-sulfoxide reductase B1 [Podarcis lilfordi]|uniref:Methionine-R-sulfoxide reductase B1 n=1 Tax=Podarcis lilfordi TaxID=74358 RepID=A0AA35PNJ4_9SAUR|nr:methionine-R-sulfoxide reductase B1 [Podarcis lilfordi]
MSFCVFRGGEIYQDHFEPGIYACSKCGYELFSSRSKYAHSSPWPAFTETLHEDSISKYLERPGAFKVSCGNSSLKFIPKDKKDKDLRELKSWRRRLSLGGPEVTPIEKLGAGIEAGGGGCSL